MKKFIFFCQSALQIFVGLSSAVSGMLLILYPSGAIFQTPADMLKGSPFQNFLVPGIILFLVNGIGQLAACLLTVRKHPLAGYVGAVFGIGLIIWIFVQANMIGGRNILQYSYFTIGVLETALSFTIHHYLLTTGHRITARNDG
jgi:hypothetical protein